MILFNHQLEAIIPLGTSTKLASKDLDLPISFIYGDDDWVQIIEEDIADRIMDQNKYYKGEDCSSDDDETDKVL